jgi:hypothetical protein
MGGTHHWTHARDKHVSIYLQYDCWVVNTVECLSNSSVMLDSYCYFSEP